MKINHCYQGDCRDVMRQLIDARIKVQCIITSPPYWGLRDYGVNGQLGQEETFSQFLENMKDVFSCCHDILADDGTLWLNMGDSYAGSGKEDGIRTGSVTSHWNSGFSQRFWCRAYSKFSA